MSDMNETSHKGLLPNGLADTLPVEAAFEAATTERLLTAFDSFGYQRVKPPMVEFEESLLDGPGQAVSGDMFRLMDPVSQRMMGVRPDITPQVARIAVTRLARAPRPMRLSYAGQVLRVRGSQLRPERQFSQIGVELIGADELAADAEVIVLAGEALHSLGVEGLSIDLNLPTLVPLVCHGLGMNEADADRARLALDRKDAAAVAEFGGDIGPLLSGMLAAAGPAASALVKLGDLTLPDAAAKQVTQLAEVIALISAAAPDLTMTVDATEFRGLEYQSGICFTIFARNVRGELGRGGRYELATGETATGFSLFGDSLMRALPVSAGPDTVYLPAGTLASLAAKLRGEGWSTLQGFSQADDPGSEATRLGCTHYLDGDEVKPASS